MTSKDYLWRDYFDLGILYFNIKKQTNAQNLNRLWRHQKMTPYFENMAVTSQWWDYQLKTKFFKHFGDTRTNLHAKYSALAFGLNIPPPHVRCVG